jgi:hypothetical protein
MTSLFEEMTKYFGTHVRELKEEIKGSNENI